MCLAWFGVVIYFFQRQHPAYVGILSNLRLSPLFPSFPLLVGHLKAFALLIGTLIGLHVWASRLLDRFGLSWNSSFEKSVFSAGLGLSLLSYGVFVIGVVQLYRPAVFWTLFVLLVVSAVAFGRKDLAVLYGQGLSDLRHTLRQIPSWGPHKLLLWTMIGVSFPMAFVPEIFYDSMVYHLGVPRFYLLEGGIRSMAYVHEKLPLVMQMQNVWGLALEGERLAKLFHWVGGFFLAISFLGMARRYGPSRGGLLAALAFFSMPMALMNLWTAGVDVRLSWVLLLSVYAWLNAMTDEEKAIPWLILGGIFGGVAAASKYTAAVCPLSFGVVSFSLRCFVDKNPKRAFREGLAFFIPVFVMMAPWLIKNWMDVGNPFFPFLAKFFGWGDFEPGRLQKLWDENMRLRPTSFRQWLFFPWTITFAEISSLSGTNLFGLMFLPGLVWWGLRRDRAPWYRPFLIATLLSLVLVFRQTQLTRVAMPMLACLFFLTGHLAGVLYDRGGRFFRTLFSILCWLAALIGFFHAIPVMIANYKSWGVLVGTEDRRDYLTYTHPAINPNPATKMFDYAKQNLPPGSRLLIVGDEKVSTCEMPFRASGVYNKSLLAVWTEQSSSADDLYRRFQKEGVTHMVININEIVRLLGYNNLAWQDETLARVSDFWDRHVRLVHTLRVKEKYFDAQIELWLCEVLPAEEAARKGRAPANVFLQFYEELMAPQQQAGWIDLRLQILRGMAERWPQVASVRERYAALSVHRQRMSQPPPQ